MIKYCIDFFENLNEVSIANGYKITELHNIIPPVEITIKKKIAQIRLERIFVSNPTVHNKKAAHYCAAFVASPRIELGSKV